MAKFSELARLLRKIGDELPLDCTDHWDPYDAFQEATSTRFVLSQLGEADGRQLLWVWSARTGKQESPGIEKQEDLMKAMIWSYVTCSDLGMLQKDMMAAGLSFFTIVQDIPDVPDRLKHTKTTEVAAGPEGAKVELSEVFELVVPPGVLQQHTTITISSMDVPGILRGPEGVHWTSGYPWSLDEAAWPREVLDQVLFSPAVDVNLHGAELCGDLQLQTWRPPGSEGMGCLLLKHHDGEDWSDITASTVCQIFPGKIVIFLQTFSPLVVLWAPVDKLIAVGKMVVDALSSRTLNCRFAAYIKPHEEGVEFHAVCRDQCVKTDEYKPGFTMCGLNKAMFDLYHGNNIEVVVSVRGGQSVSRQMELRAQHCREDDGQNIQMLLDRPNGKSVKGDVTVTNVQELPPRTVCELSFWEETDVSNQSQPVPGLSGIRTDAKTQGRPSEVSTYFYFIKEKLAGDWRDLADKLGLEQADIDNIEEKEKDKKSRCRAVLNEWKTMKGNAATMDALMKALSEIGQKNVLDCLTDEYPELQYLHPSAMETYV